MYYNFHNFQGVDHIAKNINNLKKCFRVLNLKVDLTVNYGYLRMYYILFNMTNKPMKQIRFNKKELEEFERVRKILNVPKDSWGEDSDVVKRSIRFVIDFNSLVWDKFLSDYSPLLREFIKRKMEGLHE